MSVRVQCLCVSFVFAASPIGVGSKDVCHGSVIAIAMVNHEPHLCKKSYLLNVEFELAEINGSN